MANSEERIIQTYFAPLAAGYDGAFGLHDDAALLSLDGAHALVVTADMLVAGVHFFADDAAPDIAIKALAVNLSDLAAKGAEPHSYLLSLALPRNENHPDQNWLQGFADGLKGLQGKYGCFLVGGDTVATDGPLTVSITAHGVLPVGEMVHRAGAKPGDLVYVTGTIGDAVLGLRLRENREIAQAWGLDDVQCENLLGRYLRPEPRVEIAPVLRAYASAAMDISDGLVGDFEKLCVASDVGGMIDAARVAFSQAATEALLKDPGLFEAMVTGGDDYEILATVPEDLERAFENGVKAAGLGVKVIGQIAALDEGMRVMDADGHVLSFEAASYTHF